MKKYLVLIALPLTLVAADVWDGSHYQTTCKPQFEMAEFALSQIPQKNYTSILDIGCGSGDFTVELAKIGQFVVGTDYSESMIKKAKESYGDRKNITFEVADIRSHDNISQTFDLITAFHPLQWIPAVDQAKAFETISSHLNVDGICVILVTDRYNIFYDPLMQTVKLPKWAGYVPDTIEPWNWQTVTKIVSSFESAGLRPLNVFIWNKKYHFENKQEFVDFMANWFYNAAPFDYVAPEKQTELFQEVLETFLASISYKEGIVNFECPFVIGIAEKISEDLI
jgi:SAM-dependent methyltransferase